MTDLPDNNPKSALGALKIDLSLVPPSAVIAEARVMELGAKKYGPYNWREKTVSARVYTAAALRHIFTWQDGEDIDPESGESHLAHARACLGIMLDAKSIGKLNDNRPVAGAAGRLLVPSHPAQLPTTGGGAVGAGGGAAGGINIGGGISFGPSGCASNQREAAGDQARVVATPDGPLVADGPVSTIPTPVLKCTTTGKRAPVAYCICETCHVLRSLAAIRT